MTVQATRLRRSDGEAASRSDGLPPAAALLVTGGDTRLHLDPMTQLNAYGCRPFPRPEAFTFASSTATSISERAFARVEAVRRELITGGPALAFPAQIERLRAALAQHLGLDGSGAEIVLSPSGTDSEMHALVVAQSVLSGPIVSLIAAADETGSGAALAATGRHFNALAACGGSVNKGEPVRGLGEEATSLAVTIRDAAGNKRSAAALDEEVLRAIAGAVAAGKRVLLHAMDCSKLGTRCPSAACLGEIRTRWAGAVQIVLDACQLRLSRRRLRWHLDQGDMVLVTGSKFFTGPPLSGALIVPQRVAAAMAARGTLPPGLHDYSGCSDWPPAWSALRALLPDRRNLGQLLRWTAALEEMRAYFAVPLDFRRQALTHFAAALSTLMQPHAEIEPLQIEPRDGGDGPSDEEMTTPSIIPFFLRRDGCRLSLVDMTRIYRALNRDVSSLLPPAAPVSERRIAAQLCHIGQPVAIRDATGETAAALRLSAGARYVSESWIPGEPEASQHRLDAETEQLRLIIEKLGLLVRHLDLLDTL